jgi:hypothetical protein
VKKAPEVETLREFLFELKPFGSDTSCGTATFMLLLAQNKCCVLPIAKFEIHVGELPIFPLFYQACFDRIVENVEDNASRLFFIARVMIITFVMPETAISLEFQIAESRSPTFEKTHRIGDRIFGGFAFVL